MSEEREGKIMKFSSHGNGVGLNDLYCLPETNEETIKLWEYINQSARSAETVIGDVEGSEWFGKRFVIIPFGESLKQDIKKFVEKVTN